MFFYRVDGHTWKYITKITSNLSSCAFEYKWPTNHLYIRTVTSALHINVRYLISSPCRTTTVMDSELRQLERRYNINKTMTVSSLYGITNLLYQFFKCWTIRQDEHSLYRASLTHPSVGLILAYHPHRSIPNDGLDFITGDYHTTDHASTNSYEAVGSLVFLYSANLNHFWFRLSRVFDNQQTYDKTWTKQTLK